MKFLFLLCFGLVAISSAMANTRTRQFNSVMELNDFFKRHPEIRATTLEPATEKRAYYKSDGSISRVETVSVIVLTYEE